MDVIRDQKADMEDDIWAWEDSIAEHEAEILNEVAMLATRGRAQLSSCVSPGRDWRS